MTDPPRRVVLVSGSRDWPTEHRWLVEAVLHDHLRPTDVVIHGGAAGVDTWAGEYAATLGCQVHVERPDYTRYHPKSAPKERNKVMADRLVQARQQGWDTLVLAFWHKQSPGTGHMMLEATKRDIEVRCWTTDPPGLAYKSRPAQLQF